MKVLTELAKSIVIKSAETLNGESRLKNILRLIQNKKK